MKFRRSFDCMKKTYQPGDVFLARVIIHKEVPMELQAARELIEKHGYLEALRLAEQWRDMSSPGTTSYALHNATVKEIRKAATVGKLEE